MVVPRTDSTTNGRPPGGQAEVVPSYQGFLNRLGLVGWDRLERPILSSLITSDPILLVGEHGTAKTAMAEVLAQALDLKFHAYDASKAMFEDIVGFPNPEQLGQGQLDYVPTELSIWDREFVLVDEISRANPQTQSKWLEVIRSRKLMGESLDNLQHIVAAMNPPGSYEGAMPLDPALAGRFAYILKVPTTEKLTSEDRQAVMNAVSSDDAPGRRKEFSVTLGADEKNSLPDVIERCRNRMDAIHDRYNDLVTRYLDRVTEEVCSAQPDERTSLNGRRLGMMRRNILATLALEPEPDDPAAVFAGVVRDSLPHPAMGEEIPDHVYEMAFLGARQCLWESTDEQSREEEIIDLRSLVADVLDYHDIQKAIPDLAKLGHYMAEFTRGNQQINNGARTMRRILSKTMRYGHGATSTSEYETTLDELGSLEDAVDDLSYVLSYWWFFEQKSGSNRRSLELDDVLEKRPLLRQTLERVMGRKST